MMVDTPIFRDRTHAGKLLAEQIYSALRELANLSGTKPTPIVYALPRGGIPVAVPVARLLDCPVTILAAKKISYPENPELAVGAVTASGNVIWSESKKFSPQGNDSPKDEQETSVIQQELLDTSINQAKYLEAQLIPACPQVHPEGAIAILVDDGIATGMTMAVAAIALKLLIPEQIWLCAPVAPLKLIPWLDKFSDRVIVLETAEYFCSVSNFYAEFPQVPTNEAFMHLLGARS
jgi:putative phosphoribosyl transferase